MIACEIYRKITAVYVWMNHLCDIGVKSLKKEVRTQTTKKEAAGPSTVTGELIQSIDEFINGDRRMTLNQ